MILRRVAIWTEVNWNSHLTLDIQTQSPWIKCKYVQVKLQKTGREWNVEEISGDEKDTLS